MIEKAMLADLAEILEVINTSNRLAYQTIIPKDRFIDPITTYKELSDDFIRMDFYVYRREGKIVGVVALEAEKEDVARIRYVYILPNYQRQGIGTAILHHVEAIARESGLGKARLRAVEKAVWAIDFYWKRGYRIAERVEGPSGSDVFLEKQLNQSSNAKR